MLKKTIYINFVQIMVLNKLDCSFIKKQMYETDAEVHIPLPPRIKLIHTNSHKKK